MPRKAKPAQAPKLPKGEAEQVRIRREVGHDFALKDDDFGRKRLAAGTLEASRVYEVSNDGYTATGGIVRVRAIDALMGITSLSRQQREAGLRYREDFRACRQAECKTDALERARRRRPPRRRHRRQRARRRPRPRRRHQGARPLGGGRRGAESLLRRMGRSRAWRRRRARTGMWWRSC